MSLSLGLCTPLSLSLTRDPDTTAGGGGGFRTGVYMKLHGLKDIKELTDIHIG